MTDTPAAWEPAPGEAHDLESAIRLVEETAELVSQPAVSIPAGIPVGVDETSWLRSVAVLDALLDEVLRTARKSSFRILPDLPGLIRPTDAQEGP